MAGLTSANVNQNHYEKFSYKPMRELAKYLNTYNCESQVVAHSAADIGDTGTKLAILCGQPVQLAIDSALDISSCTEGTESSWSSGSSYSIGSIVEADDGVRYRCITAHTARDGSDSDYINNEPGSSDNWARFWEDAPHTAVNASGTEITKKYEQWFMVTAKADGTLTVWEAGDQSAYGTATAECKVPLYDPKKYIPVAFWHAKNSTSATFTIGTTSTSSATHTLLQVTGPVLPHPDNWDVN